MRRAPGGKEEPRIEIGGLSVDLAAHSVSRGEEAIHLTPTEFKLLQTLVRNRGRLMTHRALLSEVWGPAWSEDTATLRTHVANLRRKIEPPDGERLIRTDPGVGYRIAL
jgi:two-component system KDP operon response regulator KdpE